MIEKDPYIEEALEEVKRLSRDPERVEEYDWRQRCLLDYISFKNAAREEGIAEGKEEGKAVGKAEGRAEGKAEGRAEGIVEGKIEAKMEDIFELLEEHGVVAEKLRQSILSQKDLTVLKKWHKFAAKAKNMNDFEKNIYSINEDI